MKRILLLANLTSGVSCTLILLAGFSNSLWSQNVGIGTTAPQQRLDVAGWLQVGDETSGASASSGGVLRYNSAGYLEVYNGSNWQIAGSRTGWHRDGNSGTNPGADYIGTSDNAGLSIQTNGTEALRVDASQRLGIGTASPKAALDLVHAGNVAALGSNNSLTLSGSAGHNFALGRGVDLANSSNDNSTVLMGIGHNTDVTAAKSAFAFGAGVNVSADSSLAAGFAHELTSSAARGVIIGMKDTLTAEDAMAVGSRLNNGQSQSLQVGYHQQYARYDEANKRISFYTDGKEAMRIQPNGTLVVEKLVSSGTRDVQVNASGELIADPTGIVQRATVNNTGNVVAGAASASKTATGEYDITFNNSFGNPPVVTVSPWQTSSGCGVKPCGTAPAQSTYCTPQSGGCDVFLGVLEGAIEDFSTSTPSGSKDINDQNTSCTCANCGGPSWKTSSSTVDIKAGDNVDFSITNSNNTLYSSIFVDFDQDGDYSDPDETVFQSPSSGTNINGQFSIPCDAVCGTTRMRVRSQEGGAPGPCLGSAGRGETHDYNIEIIASGSTEERFCNIVSVSASGFTLRCFDENTGAPADATFSFRAGE
jgi:hypothetical protein